MEDNITLKSDFRMYIEFDGPEANKGEIDIEKAGKTLVAFSKIFKKYTKDCVKQGEWKGVVKIDKIQPGCTELSMLVDIAKQFINSETTQIGAYGILSIKAIDYLGVKDFCQSFMKTLGEQLALKVFSKNKPVESGSIEGTKIYLINSAGTKIAIEYQSWMNYQILAPYFNDLYNLEAGREDIMRLGYSEGGQDTEVAQITTADKEYFSSGDNGGRFLDRLDEDFDEKNTVERRITGVFVDYYGLAHKYHFSFQARKNQDEIGKQKILCIVDSSIISKAIDYLKPENSRNITIFGNAVLDNEGKVDKLKIKWISSNPDFDPNQTTLS